MLHLDGATGSNSRSKWQLEPRQDCPAVESVIRGQDADFDSAIRRRRPGALRGKRPRPASRPPGNTRGLSALTLRARFVRTDHFDREVGNDVPRIVPGRHRTIRWPASERNISDVGPSVPMASSFNGKPKEHLTDDFAQPVARRQNAQLPRQAWIQLCRHTHSWEVSQFARRRQLRRVRRPRSTGSHLVRDVEIVHQSRGRHDRSSGVRLLRRLIQLRANTRNYNRLLNLEHGEPSSSASTRTHRSHSVGCSAALADGGPIVPASLALGMRRMLGRDRLDGGRGIGDDLDLRNVAKRRQQLPIR